MKVLCIGDIVGNPGRNALKALLPEMIKEYSLDFVVANAENAAGGSGVTAKISNQLLDYGCDVLTLGDHVWDQKEVEGFLDTTDRVIRPSNFPEEVPGKGWTIVKSRSGKKVCVINLLGRVFMRYNVACPFKEFSRIVEQAKKETNIIIVDIHAEATSEKVAFGYYSDGEASAVFGTHTHIQTADEMIHAKGTGYITDLGMTGPVDSIIGQKKENIIKRFLLSMPVRFNVAQGQAFLNGVIFNIDDDTGKTKKVDRVRKFFENNGLMNVQH